MSSDHELEDDSGSTGRRAGRLRRFVDDYTGGVSRQDVRKLFERDAQEAWAVLTRDREEGEEPAGRVRRLCHRARIFFLAVSYKLTPPRRLLFAAALVATCLAFFGVFSYRLEVESGVSVSVDADPLFYLVAIGCLTYLLALELVDRVRVRDELEVARQLQRDLLPEQAPDLAGWSFAHAYRTANEVGGDYYDFPVLPDGRLAVVIGDASGHGMAAGLLMAIANASLRTALDVDPTPEPVARLLNRSLLRAGGRRAFMTLFYGLLEPSTGHLDYVCAGHPYPLLRRAAGTIEELGSGGLPLGMRPNLALATGSVDLAPGDLLFLFTDGLVEALDPADQAFGFDRLRTLVAHGGTPDTLRTSVLTAFDHHRQDRPLADDLSLVVLARAAGPPPPP